MSAVLDTHAVLWYLQSSSKLSAHARAVIEDSIRAGREMLVSAVSVIEAIYLAERRRIELPLLENLQRSLQDRTSGLSVVPIDLHIAIAMDKIARNDVPEMPDRIIAATALYLRVPLITCDRQLQATGIETIW